MNDTTVGDGMLHVQYETHFHPESMHQPLPRRPSGAQGYASRPSTNTGAGAPMSTYSHASPASAVRWLPPPTLSQSTHGGDEEKTPLFLPPPVLAMPSLGAGPFDELDANRRKVKIVEPWYQQKKTIIA